MNLKIRYLKKSQKFFKKNSHLLNENQVEELLILAVKKIFFQEDNGIDLKQLKGNLKNYYRIRVNKIRILFEVLEVMFTNSIESVWFLN